MSENNNEPQMLNMDGLHESLKVIKVAVNRACKNGTFDSIDEAYVSAVSLKNIDMALGALKKYQDNALKNIEK